MTADFFDLDHLPGRQKRNLNLAESAKAKILIACSDARQCTFTHNVLHPAVL
jgi:hypothetical protein